ncbi:MAG: hypothetical protein ACJ75B_13220 [Flavisolibacter sp.]
MADRSTTQQVPLEGAILEDPSDQHLEPIKVVPLHVSKPELALEDLKTEDSELFGMGKAAPSTPHLTYRGGPLIQKTQVFTIFWGNNWAQTPAYKTLATKINSFFTAILVSPLIDQLSEYNTTTPHFTIGHGTLKGTKTITAGAPSPGTSITDAKIRATLNSWIAAHTLPAPNANSLYFIYTDINVKVLMGGSASCTSFCGYHNNIGSTYYAVMPFPSCAGCLGGLTAFDALTGTSSHELCEAITDAVPGSGWYDNTHGEIGDICAWKFKKVAGYNVQLEWSNKFKKCI